MPASGGPRPSISAFFPCYNDESTIADLVREADAQLGCATDDYEIIVVDDGSRDRSAAVLADLAAQVPRLRIVTHPVNRGYGGALRSGFAAATKDVVFYTDGDGQYDVKEIPIMLALLVDDTDFVNGMKMSRSDPAYRVFIGNLHKFVTRWAFWLPIDDVDCDYRLIRRAVLDRIELHSNSGSICVELVKRAQRAGAAFRQVSVRHYSRQFGSSQFFRPGRILRTYADLARMWFMLMVVRENTPHPSGRLRP
jgi:glycosyltransferase involved in cell wall biosynthesis